MRKFPVLMALVFALLLASVAVASDPTPAPIGPGELAPSVEFAMLDGDPMRLADLRGRKIVVLAFW